MTFRLVLQPAVAAILAIRSGRRDAREGREPFGWAFAHDRAQRRGLLWQWWKDAGKVFLFAAALDVVYQLLVLRWVYPGEALLVAVVLAVAPYVAIRGLTNRIARLFPSRQSEMANTNPHSPDPAGSATPPPRRSQP